MTVTDGTIEFSNLRDRVDSRIDGINADARIGADRTIKLTGSARAGEHPLNSRSRRPRRRRRWSGRTFRSNSRWKPDGLLQAPLTAKAEARLNGTVVMINGVSGTFGDGAFNSWPSVDLSSKPLVKLDLDFQRLDVAVAERRPVPAHRVTGFIGFAGLIGSASLEQ